MVPPPLLTPGSLSVRSGPRGRRPQARAASTSRVILLSPPSTAAVHRSWTTSVATYAARRASGGTRRRAGFHAAVRAGLLAAGRAHGVRRRRRLRRLPRATAGAVGLRRGGTGRGRPHRRGRRLHL